jgi:intraflagellar transport protein 140
MVAIQLNMKSEAIKLYESCNRFDLLNEMMQADGDWTKALEIA